MMVDDARGGTAFRSGHHGMRFLCFTRPVRPLHELDEHLDDHRRFLAKLEREGKLFAAGPVLAEGNERDGNGLIISNVGTVEEATALAEDDPFHSRGLRSYEIKPWMMNEGSLTVRLTYSSSSFVLE